MLVSFIELFTGELPATLGKGNVQVLYKNALSRRRDEFFYTRMASNRFKHQAERSSLHYSNAVSQRTSYSSNTPASRSFGSFCKLLRKRRVCIRGVVPTVFNRATRTSLPPRVRTPTKV